MCVLPVLFSQKECIIPLKKETEDEKSTKLKKKRKVSVVTPAVSKRNNCHSALSVNITLHDYILFTRRKRRLLQMSCPHLSQNLAVRQTCRTW